MTGDILIRMDSTDLSSSHVKADGQAIANSGDTAALYALFGANVPDARGRSLIMTGNNTPGTLVAGELKATNETGNQREPLGHYIAQSNTGDRNFKDSPSAANEGNPPFIEVNVWLEK